MRGSRHFRQGGGGGVQSDKKALTTFLFVLYLVLTYFTEVKWLISKKTIIFQGSRGGSTFSRGSNFFPGGGEGGGFNCLFPIETHILVIFRGGPDPLPPPPPLDPHLNLEPLT